MKRDSKKFFINSCLIGLIFLSVVCNFLNVFNDSNIYIVQPMIYFIAFLIVWFLGDDIHSNKKHGKDILFTVLITTLIYVIFYFFSGFVVSFANNLLSTEFKYLLVNSWAFIAILVFKEYIRHYLIITTKKKNFMKMFVFVTVMLALPNLSVIMHINGIGDVLGLIFDTLLPNLVISGFLTFVSYYSYWYTAALFIVSKTAITVFLPILPDLDSMLLAILNMLVPLLSYRYMLYNIVLEKQKNTDRKVSKKFYILYFSLLGVLVLMGLNIFPYYPVVIATNSMYPKINIGDIVIMKKVDIDDVDKGDIIEYNLDGYGIVHRVHSEKSNGEFIMKGDNNENIDVFAVKPSQVTGEYVFKIPYFGKLTLLFKELTGNPVDGEVEIEMGK